VKLVPLQAISSQTLAITLARQPTQIAVRQNNGKLFFDLSIGGSYIVRTRICRNRQRLLLDVKYRGFQGDFMFVDTQGTDDPVYTGLATRFALVYLAAGE
jgi:hypothetical protein